MSNKGKQYVDKRRQFYGFTLHPDTQDIIANISIAEKISKSEAVEKAVKEYYKTNNNIVRDYIDGKMENRPWTPEESQIIDDYLSKTGYALTI